MFERFKNAYNAFKKPLNEDVGLGTGAVGANPALIGVGLGVGGPGDFGNYAGLANNPDIPPDYTGVTVDGNFYVGSFYDAGYGSIFSRRKILDSTTLEDAYITQQRLIARNPDVLIGIEEIMLNLCELNEPVKLNNFVSNQADKVSQLFENFFNDIIIIGDNELPNNLKIYNFLRQTYIDGKICLLRIKCPKDYVFEPEKKEDDGKDDTYKILDNILNEDLKFTRENVKFLYENSELITDYSYKYVCLDPLLLREYEEHFTYPFIYDDGPQEISKDDVMVFDFGLFDVNGVRHGFLFYSIRYANQLETLQNMIIPQRFKRSVSRRVFNVDVGNIPTSRAKEYLNEIKREFKYKKSYSTETGKITESDDRTFGLVEDYWFANRGGTKGTTVEMLDEGGSFSDKISDILYFNKKLYFSMFVPTRRVFNSEEIKNSSKDEIDYEEQRFNAFLNRLRSVYNSILSKLFKEYVKCYGFEDEVEVIINPKVDLQIEKAREQFVNDVGNLDSVIETLKGKISISTIMNKVIGLSEEEYIEELEKIEKEKRSKNYKIFYGDDAIEDDSGFGDSSFGDDSGFDDESSTEE